MLIAIFSFVWEVCCQLWWLMGVLLQVLPTWAATVTACTAVYYGTRLRKPLPDDVHSIFGDKPKCIAHRGASFDAPENTVAAFKYCADNGCKFVEFDVRSCADGTLILIHDADTRRLVGESGPDVLNADLSHLLELDVALKHPNRERFGHTRISRFEDALDFLLEHDMRMIIDVKGDDRAVISGVANAFATRPRMFARAAVTAFNPLVLYQIRRRQPRVVGCLSYRPHALTYADYDADRGPTQPRFAVGSVTHYAARAGDAVMSASWRLFAGWCRVSAVLLHKDIVSPSETSYWRTRGVRLVGWSVNRPLDKMYYRSVLAASYLSNTLVGERVQDKKIFDELFPMKNGSTGIDNK